MCVQIYIDYFNANRLYLKKSAEYSRVPVQLE